MKPLIKWPGGKTREIKNIIDLIPKNYTRYIEPFVGGGAVFFHLNSDKNIINDADFDLVSFYTNIKSNDPIFFKYLDFILHDWDTISYYVEPHQKAFNQAIIKLRNEEVSFKDFSFTKDIRSTIVKPIKTSNWELKIPINGEFSNYLEKSVLSKLNRVVKLEQKHSMEFDQNKLQDHFETSIRAAYYTMLRDEPSDGLEETNARFFFIREYCYGAMFRFNRDGKFNIPYGGIDYNKKSFRNKINRLQEKSVVALLDRTDVFNLDFKSFFEEIKQLDKNDFIFFDPPYDSDFKDYGQQPFGKEDHEQLAKIFTSLPAKCVMIINKSKFIFDLYSRLQEQNSDLYLTDYEKVYAYNVRGRNNRNTKHLLITNFSQDTTIHHGKQMHLDDFN